MKESTIFIYNDLVSPDRNLQKIVGHQPFSTIIYKRESFFFRTRKSIKQFNHIKKNYFLSSDNFNEVLEDLEKNILDKSRVVLFFSYALISDDIDFSIFIEKMQFAEANFYVEDEEKPLLLIFKNIKDAVAFLYSSKDSTFSEQKIALNAIEKENTFLCNASDYRQFISFLSGGFDARFFNSLTGTEYTVTKSSTDKTKMKKEYMYYHLLPDEMKIWCVLPYDFKETEDRASYTMERLGVTDMAIRWIHHAISEIEFNRFLKKAFYYLNHRISKEVEFKIYEKNQSSLYVTKVKERIEDLKKCKDYPQIENNIKYGTEFESIDKIFEKYITLYNQIISATKLPTISVIGHGDFCFSNTLYDMDTDLFKLIDPKGALKESDLWMDPFYDIAKLSHSICGCYDFFNNGLFTISLNNDMLFSLNIDWEESDRKIYQDIFREKLEENGISYTLIRIYEASLFLSMLPLHMDNPQKVFGFILNAIDILDQVNTLLKNGGDKNET